MQNKNTCNGCEREKEDSGYCLDCCSGDRFVEGNKKSSNKKRTNFDIIKNMSVDELADFLKQGIDDMCFDNCLKSTGDKLNCPFGEDVTLDNCKQCIKQWLESECESNV